MCWELSSDIFFPDSGQAWEREHLTVQREGERLSPEAGAWRQAAGLTGCRWTTGLHLRAAHHVACISSQMLKLQ